MYSQLVLYVGLNPDVVSVEQSVSVDADHSPIEVGGLPTAQARLRVLAHVCHLLLR